MEKLKIDDLLNYQFLSGITASPSGEKAAFLIKKADKVKNDYDSWIAVVDFRTEEVRKLTSFGEEDHLIFEDDSTILFSSVRKQDDKAKKNQEKTVFYRLPLKGGEAERAFALEYTVESIKKVSDKIFVFKAAVDLNRPEDEDKLEEYQDYHIIEELPYWKNGSYFVSRFRNSLFLYDEVEKRVEKITAPFFSVSFFETAGGKIFYSGVSYKDVLPTTSGICVYDMETGRTKEILPGNQMRVHSLACGRTAAGTVLYFAASGMDRYGGGQYPDLYVCRDGEAKLAVKCGMSVGNTIAGDVMLGGGDTSAVADGRFYFVACARATGELYVLNREQGALASGDRKKNGREDSGRADGDAVKKVFNFNGAIDCFCAVKGGFAMIARTPGRLQEIYFYNDRSKTCKKISSLNEEVLRGKYVGELHEAGFVNSDGISIDGWVIYPDGYDPTDKEKRYPAILDMHGGPRGAFGDTFFHEMQCFANGGYFVLLCNPRGSDGRGNAFSDLRGKYGTIDFQDFMEFTGHVLNLYPAIDENRLGVTGGSYGGWMTNWMIGHTDRFAAAVSQRSFSNWLSDFGCSEIGFSFDVNENGGKLPWSNPMELWERSPLAYADRAKTPTLFIHSLKDYNCPLSEGMQMFAALKYHGVPSKAVLFEEENHELSRSGKPLHRLRRLEEMKAWFDRYLMMGEEG